MLLMDMRDKIRFFGRIRIDAAQLVKDAKMWKILLPGDDATKLNAC